LRVYLLSISSVCFFLFSFFSIRRPYCEKDSHVWRHGRFSYLFWSCCNVLSSPCCSYILLSAALNPCLDTHAPHIPIRQARRAQLLPLSTSCDRRLRKLQLAKRKMRRRGMDIGTINRSDSAAGKKVMGVLKHASGSPRKTPKMRLSPLHMGHHEPGTTASKVVRVTRGRYLSCTTGKPPPQAIRISIDGLQDRRRVGGLWELESGRELEDRRIN